MHYIKQDDYDSFFCIADKCPESCCEGWQIVIDEDSLNKYAELKTDFGKRLNESIDWEEETFKQNNKRCAFLNNNNLCDIQLTLGEKGLCRTCTMYPRHTEEYEDIKELSLSLSCPRSAEMLLEREAPMSFIEYDTDEEDDFEEFDDLLFFKLVDTRFEIYKIIQNRSLPLFYRMDYILKLAKSLQECLDDDRLFDMDELIENAFDNAVSEYEASFSDKEYTLSSGEDFYTAKRMYSVLYELEMLHDDWEDTLEETWNTFFTSSRNYDALRLSARLEIAGEQLLMFFFYTYFCGAVYDDMIYSKAALGIYSVRWIFLMYFAALSDDTSDRLDILIRAAYRYAREVEHSEPNIEYLEEWFDNNMPEE